MKTRVRLIGLVISFLVSLTVYALNKFDKLENFENKSLDWRFERRGPQAPVSPIVIAAIDDDALQTVGKWPWPRKIHGQLIDTFRKAGAAAVVYDVVFYEPDRYQPENDRILETAIRRNGHVVSCFDFK